eukprot:s863_g13.t1
MLEHVAYPLTHQLSNLSAELRVHSLRERVRTAAPLRAAAACGDLVHVQQVLRQVDTSSEAAKVALQVKRPLRQIFAAAAVSSEETACLAKHQHLRDLGLLRPWQP